MLELLTKLETLGPATRNLVTVVAAILTGMNIASAADMSVIVADISTLATAAVAVVSSGYSVYRGTHNIVMKIKARKEAGK